MPKLTQLQQFRRDLNTFMGKHPQSPLSRERQKAFAGLRYFGESADFIIQARAEPFNDPTDLITIQTSTGDTRQYMRWGLLHFIVDGVAVALLLLSNPQERDDYFLPFKDATNGTETYGTGRYLDSHRPGIIMLPNGNVQLDFNYAYNPYCAYSPSYSCPLPPRENWLTVPIKAGEMAFDQ